MMKKLIAWVEIPATRFDRAVDFYSNVLQTEFKIYESSK
jgi:predicted enzyme related to lactoylglutathione lyase